MALEMQVHVQGLRLVGYHGVFPEEQRVPNLFEFNITVRYTPIPNTVFTLENTIDYGAIVTIVKANMQPPVALLETLAANIGEQLTQTYPHCTEISIQIIKTQAPLPAFNGTVGITYHWKK
jgi:7,8-dihydroneopterin aldolase/epimerase/oxygenase